MLKFTAFIKFYKVQPHDAYVALITTLTTLIFYPHIQTGLYLGIVLSLGLFLYRTMTPRFVELPIFLDQNEHLNDRIKMIKFSGSLYFANAQHFHTKMLELLSKNTNTEYIIIDMSSINTIDSTGEHILFELIESSKKNMFNIIFARATHFENLLSKSGIIQRYGDSRFFDTRTDAIRYTIDTLSEQ